MPKGIFFGFLLSSSLLTAQGIVRSGYTASAPVSVAPGQIATFYVAGLRALTGITATLQQQTSSTPAPVQSVSTVSLCPDDIGTPITGCGTQTAVTVQIPYELVPRCPLCASPLFAATPATLLISQNGTALGAIELNPLADEVHVLKACDMALGPPSPTQPNLTGLPCAPLVTHADGGLVSASSPANVGEALTVWAFGLGQTTPAAITGQTAKMAPAAETFNLDFNYEVNALAEKPFTGSPDHIPLNPLFAGLAPGYVGLYQVNFIVPPQPPNGTPRCALPGTAGPGANLAQSNFTVSIGGQFSFDGAGICVATQIPVD
jgi:uncharacterized protein (TIGR03437 family)